MSSETISGRAVHPALSMFPMMSDDEIEVLAEDIRVNGQQIPIMVAYLDESCTETMLIDGRNRSRACEMLGIEPHEELYSAKYMDDLDAWIVSNNLHRRHLTPSQRAAVAVEYERLFAKHAKARQRQGKENLPDPSRAGQASDQAGDMFDVSGRLVRDAKYVAENDPDEFERVRSGAISASAAAKRLREAKAASKPASGEMDAAAQRADSEAKLLNIVRAILEPERMAEYSPRALDLLESTLVASLDVLRRVRIDDKGGDDWASITDSEG